MSPSYLSTERILANYLNNPTEKNALLLHERLQTISYYVPIEQPKGKDAEMQRQEARRIGEAIKKGDWKNVPLYLIPFENDHALIFPVYTSEKLLRAEQSAGGGLRLAFHVFYSLLEQRDDIAYLLVDPNTTPITFERSAFLESFSSVQVRTRIENYQPGTTVNFTSHQARAKAEAIEALLAKAQDYPEISKVWLAVEEGETPDKSRWLIVLDSSDPNPDIHRALVTPFLEAQKENTCALCYAEDELAKDIIERFDPIYLR